MSEDAGGPLVYFMAQADDFLDQVIERSASTTATTR